jgi:hypothetical protein
MSGPNGAAIKTVGLRYRPQLADVRTFHPTNAPSATVSDRSSGTPIRAVWAALHDTVLLGHCVALGMRN